ncbi:MAG: Uncharacterized protein CEN91_385 [Candidatus Berkelbacteria bacterium Licking1014_85]|uniref:Primosomal protein N' 3' DNA-binding domain-containing protein n=1 Tax=Candidatus Berkelbacteria bacterium Licking1014_85 TaxID=2017148 RepID=A0A554LIH6_9BACT|nr:MAG: Uncharacterized protein CEN91_385 [Candidatus Berkelbacteria bacterium Licking1014_85]
MYAEIFPNHKLNSDEPLIYSIPAELIAQIKIGQLVEIPFRKNLIAGVISNFQKSANGVKTKPIARILSGKYFSKNNLAIAKYISQKYYTPLSKTIFSMLPDIPKNNIAFFDKIDKQLLPPKIKYYISDDLSRLNYYNKFYLDSTPTLFLFPTIDRAHYFKKYVNLNGEIISSKTKIQALYSAQKDFYENLNSKLIGTKNLLFFESHRKYRIIIDSYDHFSFESDQQPNIDIEDIASVISAQNNCEIILFSSAMTQRSQSFKSIYLSKSTCKTIVKPTLNQRQIDFLIEVYSNKPSQRTLIFNPVFNYGLLFCSDCNDFFKCKKCFSNLIYNQKAFTLECRKCQQIYAVDKCQKCSGRNYTEFGFGLEKNIENYYSQNKNFALASAKFVSPNIYSSNLVVGTQKIFDYFLKPFDKVIALNFDIILNSHEYDYDENAIQILANLKNLSKKELLVFSNYLDHEIFQIKSQNDLKKFFKNALINRKKFQLPPFAKIINIKAINFDPFKLKNETIKIHQELMKIEKNQQFIISSFSKPEFLSKNNIWQSEAQIKISPFGSKNIDEKLRKILYNLPSSWRMKVKI